MNVLSVLLLVSALSGPLRGPELVRLAREQLPGTLGADSLRWTLANPWPALALPAGADEVRLSAPPGGFRPGVVPCEVQVLGAGQVLAAAGAALRCERIGPGLRLGRAVRAGEVIQPPDVQCVRGVLPAGDRPLSDPALAGGRRARRTLPEGAWLTPDCVERTPVVKRNSPLEVHAEMQSVVIRFRAQAQQEGGLGEVILARGPGRGALLSVRVTGPGQAELVP
ncbi:MAG TPA: flagellar basal body P-ring formation chaperone FlgA [Candidatus Saccharimonadales bacterium]|nr:flagellar basal body P-ring formation chaperone FlgA [Candidatus Saccharimonadales bacterium]